MKFPIQLTTNMKFNFLKIFIFSLLFSNFSNGQEKKVKLFSDFQFGPNLKLFNGKNFLSDGHNATYLGFHSGINFVEYNKFGFGGIYEINTSSVEKPEIVGNFNSITLNHFAGYLSYKFSFSENKFTLVPKLLIGDIKTKQKANGYYANNNGNYWGIIGQINYNFSEKFAVFSSVGYNFYTFKVQTTSEYLNYFNKSNALNFSLGIKF